MPSKIKDVKRSTAVILVIVVVLILDQWLKFYIKMNLEYGQGFDILGLNWAKIHFVENAGMAFGFSFGEPYGKLLLSLFRIIMVGFLLYILHNLIKAKESFGLLISFALIIAGALGNIIDSVFYGMIFSETPKFHGGVAEFLPQEGGYSSFLHGKVVDMLYFPLIDTTVPEWFPFWAGERFEFFKPVFNIADSAISTGVISILLFHRRLFKSSHTQQAASTGIPASVTETQSVNLKEEE